MEPCKRRGIGPRAKEEDIGIFVRDPGFTTPPIAQYLTQSLIVKGNFRRDL